MGITRRRAGRYGVSRRLDTRAPLPVVAIVCDDTKTAVAYFNELKREVKARVALRVERASRCGASAASLLGQAEAILESLEHRETGDSAWVLLDMEAEEDRRTRAVQAKQQGKGVVVLLSDPCFEVWTLAHLVDTGEAFTDCTTVLIRVKAEWKRKFGVDFGDKKAQADYSKLMPLRENAIRNAKKRDPKRDASWTEVYRVVEEIDRLCSARGAS